MEKIKIMIADDHRLFIRGIESILLEDDSLQVVGQAHNGIEAYEMAVKLKPDVILLDVTMPIMDGLEALKLIIKELPNVKILMVTVNENTELLYEAIQNGAKGYILKDLLPNELLTFVQMVNRGESVISGQMARKIIETMNKNHCMEHEDQIVPKGKIDILTKREKEILSLVMKGQTNREIGQTLEISENTVKNHLRNIMEKLQMSNRVQAATYALKEGWLQSI
jgi:RNA polymerase sigma factor (sigma-70 family)